MPRRTRRSSTDSSRSPERIQFARDQRATANQFSSDVWQMLRRGNMEGEKFRREVPEPPYTLDFVCLALKLVVEVDGSDHVTDQGIQHDAERDRFLQTLGYLILRVPGFEVLRDRSAVRKNIAQAVRKRRAALGMG
ncbi:hypothetical protein FF011L_21210 [Roseimaritima multifibrata]|uniref:DUF559 domain-containing protein n=1 Tax=Roseimaritima multifibrata TaxID=1930274 RepID=A0A517MEP7_9BACT|nr:DUF559 domain-containing protein [Roseimaritima multifibrata]QDS93358.1 hypothetical protein FF011L_21210 [Roseimaritima multifibrata]